MQVVAPARNAVEALRVVAAAELSGKEHVIAFANEERGKLLDGTTVVANTALAVCLALCPRENGPAGALVDDWALRSIKLQQVWDSVQRCAIHRALDSLEEALPDGRRFLVSDKLTVADIFLFSGLYYSRLCTEEFLFKRPNLAKFIQEVQKEPAVSAALKKVELECGIKSKVLQGPAALKEKKEKWYLTTAINYTNGSPHIGHAYEISMADILTRYHRTVGRDVFFLTGTDEHGQKIVQTAEAQGLSPLDLCSKHAEEFKKLNAALNVTGFKFRRTTDAEHYLTAQELWRKSRDAGDIYLGKYVGWYNVREEAFVPDHEAQTNDYKDPVSGVAYQKMEEVSYFFRMSKFQKRLVDHIEKHSKFIQPEYRRNEILQRLKEPLQDLSISRTTFKWGVPVPDDDKHVMYVWFDALTNYITGVNVLGQNKGPEDADLGRYWPCNCHFIGKDILWFHTVIWPCILMSAEIPLFETCFAHGFVVAGDGKKMSKSLGNVVDPVDLLNKGLPSDTFRYFISRTSELGRDIRFDFQAMEEAHNADLADTLGNLVHRCVALIKKFCDGVIPDVGLPEGPAPFDAAMLASSVDTLMVNFQTQEATDKIMKATRDTNKYLTDHAPWAMKGDDKRKQEVCRAVAEALYILAHFLECVIPTAAGKMFERLGSPPSEIRGLSPWFDNLKAGTAVKEGDVLFVKMGKQEK